MLYASQAVVLATIALLVWRWHSAGVRNQPWHTYQTTVFNTPCVIRLQGDGGECSAVARAIIGRLFALHNCLNRFDKASAVSRFNAWPVQKPFECEEPLWTALMAARRGHAITDGAFDITILPLLEFWKKHRSPNSATDFPEEFSDAKAKVGFSKLLFDESGKTLTKTISGQEIDFGGMAKGLALDIVKEVLSSRRVASFVIDLGGNLYISEDITEALIAAPADREKSLCTIDKAGGQFIATSSNGERPIAPGTVGHIINPMTGAAMQPAWSVTAITPNGVDSDIFSTAVFVGGEQLARKISAGSTECGFVIYPMPPGAPRVTVGNVICK